MLTFAVLAPIHKQDQLWATLNSTLGQAGTETLVILPVRTAPRAAIASIRACCQVLESPSQYPLDGYLLAMQQARGDRIVFLEAGDVVAPNFSRVSAGARTRGEGCITVHNSAAGRYVGAILDLRKARNAMRTGFWRQLRPAAVHERLCDRMLRETGHHHYETHIQASRTRMADTVVISTYWGDRFDPQRCQWWIPADESGRMHLWQTGIEHHDAPAILIHDRLSPAFVKEHTSSALQFHRVPAPPSHVNVNSWRFSAIRDLLPTLPYDFVLLSDLFDVRIGRHPALLPLKDETDLWFSAEPVRCGAWRYDLKSLGPNPLNGIEDRMIVNAGAFGGRREPLLDIVVQLCDRLEKMRWSGAGPAPDMIQLNHLVHRFRGDYRFCIGHQHFSSRFLSYDTTAPAIFIHK